MGSETTPWPYAPTLLRLALAMGLGLFIGIERERRRKEAGLRTFAFASMLGGVGGLLDDRFALLALALLGILVVLLNIETIHTGEGARSPPPPPCCSPATSGSWPAKATRSRRRHWPSPRPGSWRGRSRSPDSAGR